jgi:hypothetical protein
MSSILNQENDKRLIEYFNNKNKPIVGEHIKSSSDYTHPHSLAARYLPRLNELSFPHAVMQTDSNPGDGSRHPDARRTRWMSLRLESTIERSALPWIIIFLEKENQIQADCVNLRHVLKWLGNLIRSDV